MRRNSNALSDQQKLLLQLLRKPVSKHLLRTAAKKPEPRAVFRTSDPHFWRVTYGADFQKRPPSFSYRDVLRLKEQGYLVYNGCEDEMILAKRLAPNTNKGD